MTRTRYSRKLIATFLSLMTVCATLGLSGCNKSNTITDNDLTAVKDQDTSADLLAVVNTEPTSPSILSLGQKTKIFIEYELNFSEVVQIYARPYNNGIRANGYRAHPLVTCKMSDNKSGVVEGWFYFDRPAEVDEIRVVMRDKTSKQVIKTVSHKINARWIK